MDELKLLIEMVANLPTLAVWVLVGYLVYKIVVIGSIYGLIRFGIDKLHNWLTSPARKSVEIRVLLDGEVMGASMEPLIAQLRRIKKANLHFIHESEVDWLRQAIDDRITKDAEEAARKATEKAKA